MHQHSGALACRPVKVPGRKGRSMPPASIAPGVGARCPQVRVGMSEPGGNLFCVLDRVGAALKAAGVPAVDVQHFLAEAGQGNYERLLAAWRQLADAR